MEEKRERERVWKVGVERGKGEGMDSSQGARSSSIGSSITTSTSVVEDRMSCLCRLIPFPGSTDTQGR